jgi:hypothetical protein
MSKARISEDVMRRAAENVMVRRLQEAGYVVVPPTERKVRNIGPFTIITDPIGIAIGWRGFR